MAENDTNEPHHYVLLVEDDDDVRTDLAFLIEQRGHYVSSAPDGQEALATLRSQGKPCVILLDLMMPIMDGWQLRAALLDDASLARIPVVLLSGAADLRDQAKALRAADYLTKPIDLKKLYALLADHCPPPG